MHHTTPPTHMIEIAGTPGFIANLETRANMRDRATAIPGIEYYGEGYERITFAAWTEPTVAQLEQLAATQLTETGTTVNKWKRSNYPGKRYAHNETRTYRGEHAHAKKVRVTRFTNQPPVE